MDKPANLKRRSLAFFIDYGIYYLVDIAYIMYFGAHTKEGYQVSGFKSLPSIVFWVIYFPVTEMVTGKTLGKYFLDIKVITLDGKRLNFSSALKRRIIDPLDLFFFGIVAIITYKNTELHQRVGDLWAKTQVVQD